MNNSFTGKISEKEFVNEIKGCKTIDLKNFSKEIISEETDSETGIITTIVKIKGYFSTTMKKIAKPLENKDSILEFISKEFQNISKEFQKRDSVLEIFVKGIKEVNIKLTNIESDVTALKQDVAELKQDVAELKQDVADIKIRVTNLEQDVSELKQDVTDIKKCPTIKKELSAL